MICVKLSRPISHSFVPVLKDFVLGAGEGKKQVNFQREYIFLYSLHDNLHTSLQSYLSIQAKLSVFLL